MEIASDGKSCINVSRKAAEGIRTLTMAINSRRINQNDDVENHSALINVSRRNKFAHLF